MTRCSVDGNSTDWRRCRRNVATGVDRNEPNHSYWPSVSWSVPCRQVQLKMQSPQKRCFRQVILKGRRLWVSRLHSLDHCKKVNFQPGVKSKPHSHNIPGAALIQEGELLCEVSAKGLKRRFVEWDDLLTTFKNELHSCENTDDNLAKA